MRLNKSAILFAGVVIAASMATGAASAANAVVSSTVSTSSGADIPNLKIGKFGWNWPGADKTDNANAEYVDVENTSSDPVNVKGLVVEDAWRHGQPDSYKGPCNRFTISSVPQADGTTAETLPGSHVLRVYVGSGTNRVFTWGGVTYHAVYGHSPSKCGYNSHIFNNGPGSSKSAPWDTVYVQLGADTEFKSYNFSFGYWVP